MSTDAERELISRLNRGLDLIAKAERDGNFTEANRLTNFWLKLLQDYIRLCDSRLSKRGD